MAIYVCYFCKYIIFASFLLENYDVGVEILVRARKVRLLIATCHYDILNVATLTIMNEYCFKVFYQCFLFSYS